MASKILYKQLLRQGARFDAQPWRRAMLVNQPALKRYTAVAAQPLHLMIHSNEASGEMLQVRDIIKKVFRSKAQAGLSHMQQTARSFDALRMLQAAHESPAFQSSISPSLDSADACASRAEVVSQAHGIVDAYLSLVSASSASAGAAELHGASAAASPAAGFSIHLLEQSRLKHQLRRWTAAAVTELSAADQRRLEELVAQLGTAVQAKDVEAVAAVQASLSTPSNATLAVHVLSNHAIVDAWVDFLFDQRAYAALTRLLYQRLHSGVNTSNYALSRRSLSQLMAACAIEGDAAGSLMLLRESSWGSLPAAQVAADAAPAAADDSSLAHSAAAASPSSVNAVPSWIPAWYTSPLALAELDRARAAASAGEDYTEGSLLQAAGEEYGSSAPAVASVAVAATAPSTSVAPILAPRPKHARLSISLSAGPVSAARLAQMASPFPFRTGSTPLAAMRGQSVAAAGMNMSTRARSYAARAYRAEEAAAADQASAAASAAIAPPQRPATPPTPLPILDLFTELSVDSRLVELAILAAVRKQSLNAAAKIREAAETAAVLSADPLAASLHEHAQLFAAAAGESESTRSLSSTGRRRRMSESPRQSPRRTLLRAERDLLSLHDEVEPDSADDEFDLGEEEEDQANSPTLASRQPLAFQLWSLMRSQRVPLQHSSSLVQLMSSLTVEEGSDAAGPFATALSALSSEMTHSRSSSGHMQHKWLRADVQRFRFAELALLARLSSSGGAADYAWQAVDLLRQMHREGLHAPPADVCAQLYRSVCASASGVARSQLAQELLMACEDFAAADPGIAEEIVAACADVEAMSSME